MTEMMVRAVIKQRKAFQFSLKKKNKKRVRTSKTYL